MLLGGIFSLDILEIFDDPKYVFPAGMARIGYPQKIPDLSMRLPLEAVVRRNKYRLPSDDIIREWYSERESVWNILSDKLKKTPDRTGDLQHPSSNHGPEVFVRSC